jgi:hypothetical protein
MERAFYPPNGRLVIFELSAKAEASRWPVKRIPARQHRLVYVVLPVAHWIVPIVNSTARFCWPLVHFAGGSSVANRLKP